MKNICFLFVIFNFFFFGCRKNDETKPDDVWVTEVNSYINLNIDGMNFDTIEADCIRTYTGTINGLVWSEDDFVLRQGFSLDIEEGMSVECMVYIFDKANRYQLYTPELMADYINNRKDNVSIDVTIEKGGLVLKNQWFDDWKIPEFLLRDIVDSNAVFTITTEEPVRPNCTENWPLLPINVMYSGILETKDGQNSVSLDSLSFRWYLLELLE